MREGSFLAQSKDGVGSLSQAPHKDRVVAAALLGQLLSLLLASVGLCSSLLVKKGVSVPAFQTVPNYALLALVYGSALLVRQRRPAHGLLSYAAVSLLDVEGNFLMVLAYRFTYITSVQLLGSFSIPCVFVLSWLFLKARYRWAHCGGAALCLASLALLVATDKTLGSPSAAGGGAPLAGDALALAGAALYAGANVAQERLLRRGATAEVLAFMGLFGLLWAGLQSAALEHAELRTVRWNPEVGALLVGYTAALFGFYSGVPAVLRWGGAGVLNLSLLSANFWAALARAAFLGGFSQSSALAFVAALALVSVGLMLYTAGGSVYPTTAASEDCYWVIRPGWQSDHGGGRATAQTPRLADALTPRVGSGTDAKPGSGSRRLRTWLARGRRPEAALAAADGADLEEASSGGGGEPHGGTEFWMRPLRSLPDQALHQALPALPSEGAQGTDPYTKVSATAQRSPSVPPSRPS